MKTTNETSHKHLVQGHNKRTY